MRLSFTGVGTALDYAVHRRRARSTRPPSGGWRGGRSTPACTSSCRAARPARRRRSSPAERRRIVEIVVDEAEGRALVLAGAGGYDTREVIHAVAEMQKAGAQGILSVTPYYNKPTPEGLYQHYKAIAEQHDAADHRLQRARPDRLQRRSGDARRAWRRFPNIVGVKEASGNMTQMAEICRARAADFIVLSGDDALTLPLMAIGGRGIISVASNEVPAEMVQMVEAAERGDFATARHWHEKLLPLMQVNFVESSPGPVQVRDGRDGPVRGGVPAADGAAAAGVAGQRFSRVLKDFGLPVVAGARARELSRTRISALFAAGRAARTRRRRATAFFELQQALERGERARRRARRRRRHPAGASTRG